MPSGWPRISLYMFFANSGTWLLYSSSSDDRRKSSNSFSISVKRTLFVVRRRRGDSVISIYKTSSSWKNYKILTYRWLLNKTSCRLAKGIPILRQEWSRRAHVYCDTSFECFFLCRCWFCLFYLLLAKQQSIWCFSCVEAFQPVALNSFITNYLKQEYTFMSPRFFSVTTPLNFISKVFVFCSSL